MTIQQQTCPQYSNNWFRFLKRLNSIDHLQIVFLLGWARNANFLVKIILSGIISKVCLATTSNKLERPLNRDDEKSSVPLSVKPRRPRSLVVKACLIDDRSSPSLAGSRRGDWQSERLYQNNLLNLKIKN